MSTTGLFWRRLREERFPLLHNVSLAFFFQRCVSFFLGSLPFSPIVRFLLAQGFASSRGPSPGSPGPLSLGSFLCSSRGRLVSCCRAKALPGPVGGGGESRPLAARVGVFLADSLFGAPSCAWPLQPSEPHSILSGECPFHF